MTNLINDFMSMTVLQQGLFVFWSVCVVMFYSILLYSIGGGLINSFKRLF